MSRKVLNPHTAVTRKFRLRSVAPAVSTLGLALLAHIPCCGLPVALSAFGGAAALSGLQTLRPWFLVFGAALISVALIQSFKPISCSNRKPMLERGIAVVGLLVLLYAGYAFANDMKSGHLHSTHEHTVGGTATEECHECDDH